MSVVPDHVLPPATWRYLHDFSPEQAKALADLRFVCGTSSAIVAGGWVRDAISGHEPKDVDVFLTGEDVRATIGRLPSWTTVTERHWDDESMSSGEMVESVCQVDGLLDLPVQLIAVADPLLWVTHFDAHCNMLYVPLAPGSFETVYVSSAFAVAHAKLRVWEVNPAAQESRSVLMTRADKFETRGFQVRRESVFEIVHVGEDKTSAAK